MVFLFLTFDISFHIFMFPTDGLSVSSSFASSKNLGAEVILFHPFDENGFSACFSIVKTQMMAGEEECRG